MPNQTSSASQPISLMAAGELRDALTAIEEGKGPAAIAALMAIDSASWQAIEQRLTALVGADLRELLLKGAGGGNVAAQALG
ncbi:hypothetical protein [Streptomyces griseocarneus]|uniref:hypothetical protein n=1 Tax=Streptomyces griseocarneus TaxID=51201 RepID=UPI00167DD8B6|nr:hypothetical protein [Streptomyces griseocarneus]MBZ6473218.1 hypothetical protein [Streptomyces griseocarneus]GHG60509.1 hypothetical protein GCM10018779_27880 [Streptomyces griseocarneus]